MSKFTFSRQLFKQQPNKRHYNEVINDFKSVVNGGKITSENLRDESISFRHLKGPTSILLYKDCADDIFRFGSGSTSHLLALIGQTGYSVYKTGETDSLNTAKLWYTPENPEGGVKIADFTIEYYPYNAGPRTKIAPCFQKVGSEGWVVMDQFEKRCGIVAGQSAIYDVVPYKPTKDRYPVHPVLSRLSAPNNSTGRPRTDKLHTGAIPQCVRLNIQIGKTVSASDGTVTNTEDIQAWGMAIKHEHQDRLVEQDLISTTGCSTSIDHIGFTPSCSRFDHLNLIMVARKF